MMKSKQENQALFEEALALREAMRLLIHNQVVNKKNSLKPEDYQVVNTEDSRESKSETSATI